MASELSSHNAVVSSGHTWPGAVLGLTGLDTQIPAVYSATISEESMSRGQSARLDVTTMMGLPLDFCVCMPGPNDEFHKPAHNDFKLSETPDNPLLRTLSIKKISDEQIASLAVGGIPRPNIMLTRADGGRLLAEHVMLVWLFADEALARNTEDNKIDWLNFRSEVSSRKFMEFWATDPRLKGLDIECLVKMGNAVICIPQQHTVAIHGYKQPALLGADAPPSMPQQILLHITARIGLPLYFGVVESFPDDQTVLGVELFDTPDNPILRHFTLRKQPNGPGMISWQFPGMRRPTIMLVRADGKRLDIEHVLLMWMFMEDEYHKTLEEEAFEDPHVVNYNAFAANMTPKKFVEFWERLAALGRLYGACPVKLGCKVCGKMGSLLRCGKCGLVQYCGRECQKSDWALHKKLCAQS